MEKIYIEQITIASRPAFLALSQQYEAEFSKITGKQPDHDGKYSFTDEKKDYYEPWICKLGEKVIGFAVIDISRARFDVAEFYITPPHRRTNFGQYFASYLFNHYVGPWQVRQIIGAEYARDFWIKVIKSYSEGKYSASKELDLEWGEVYIQRFHSNSNDTKK